MSSDGTGAGASAIRPVLDLTSLDTTVGEFISSYNQRTHSSINTSPNAAWIGQGSGRGVIGTIDASSSDSLAGARSAAFNSEAMHELPLTTDVSM